MGFKYILMYYNGTELISVEINGTISTVLSYIKKHRIDESDIQKIKKVN